ncbi:hypothetical protein [Maritimibacter sp. DP1N21-5]|uniref:hypothetical protein n=1 Tax=Maritimibacter sp. DP1N21-5 TaxID=2836867 RepID=UPI001C43CCCB|nr:hypothetical protein [Maritimibacter sp. DP1N21-5]MBV7409738.1 hypothetical protein [Maritimibacter sp. DP1N21-5]
MRKAIAALALGAMCVGAMGGSAMAEVMSGDAAKKQLFSARNMILLPQDLSVFQGAMRDTVNLTLDQMRGNSQMSKFVEGGYGYYGAVAFPVAGAEAVPPVIVAQLNTPQAAASAAVTTCQQQNGGQCAVAALLLPKGYKSRDLTLSQAATQRVMEGWDEGLAPKYLAYSPSTSGWGIAKGAAATPEAALQSCKQSDCVIVIEDR